MLSVHSNWQKYKLPRKRWRGQYPARLNKPENGLYSIVAAATAAAATAAAADDDGSYYNL